MIEIGDKAPEFCLANRNDEEVCLRNFLGRWVILYFYPKDNTKGCTIEAVDFSQNLEGFEKMKAVVVGISPDSPKSHQNFANKHSLEVTLLSDTEHKVLEKYGVWQLRKMYGREYFGVIRSTFIINPEGKTSYIFRKVKVKGHVEEVKRKLKELRGA